MRVLRNKYYQNKDTLFLAKDLIGKYLMTCIDGKTCGGMISETECYMGVEDRASHAYKNRRTKRTEVMFEAGGVAYVYLCYGLHALLNVVTHEKEIPHAILIRAIIPEIGIEHMLKRRNKKHLTKTLTNGPGALTQALGISTLHNKTPLTGSTIWIEDRGISSKDLPIETTPRIGVEYAKEDALKPWRFVLIADSY